MTYVVSYKDYLQELAIDTLPDYTAAETHVKSLPEGHTAYIIDKPFDVKQMGVALQVDLFNALRDEEQQQVAPQHFVNADDRMAKLFQRVAGTRVDMIVGRKPKANEPKGLRAMKKGLIYHVKAYVTEHPHCTDAEIAEHVKGQGIENASMNTISTFRADHVHTLRVMADLGRYEFPAATASEEVPTAEAAE